LLNEKLQNLESSRSKLKGGITKLKDANEIISTLKEKLKEL